MILEEEGGEEHGEGGGGEKHGSGVSEGEVGDGEEEREEKEASETSLSKNLQVCRTVPKNHWSLGPPNNGKHTQHLNEASDEHKMPGVHLWDELDHGVGGGEADPGEDGEGEAKSHKSLRHRLPPIGSDDDAHLFVMELPVAVIVFIPVGPV